MATTAEENPELYHYTTNTGLEGIINSQTLWVTHYSFLNDGEEITHLRKYLPKYIDAATKRRFANILESNTANKDLVIRYGGIENVLSTIITDFTKASYKALLEGDSHAEFFIVSFCTASTKEINQHGLLSEWRAYGQDGGYAIVFDTSELMVLTQEEGNKWGYHVAFGNVVYSSDPYNKVRKELGEDIDSLANGFMEYVNTGGNPHTLLNHYNYLIKCTCLFKHWGFKDENEVRLVVIPANKDAIESARKKGTPVKEKPGKLYMRNEIAVPYLNLFEGITSTPQKCLPIKRIIVGPHPEKHERKRYVENLLVQNGIRANVTVSEIPYLRRSS